MNINRDEFHRCLSRLAVRAGRELLAKEPHWGDAILCDGLIYATRALRLDAPAKDAISWFQRRLEVGPRTDGWIWFWSAEALPALDIHLLTSRTEYLEYARKVVDALEHKAA